MITDLRIRILRFFRKNKVIIFFAVCFLVLVIIVNNYLKNHEFVTEPETTRKPHTSVMDSTKSTPEKTAKTFENLIDEYIGYCNDADYASAFNMLSDDCKNYGFNNNLTEYMAYIYTIMPEKKEYVIQDFSNYSGSYIYQVKFIDDILSTGLTNSVFEYTEEKITFKKVGKEWEMSVGNFIATNSIKNIFENDYLKVDVKSVIKYYSVEEYNVKLTNRTNYTIVISDSSELDEILLKLNSEDTRKPTSVRNIVLGPNESQTLDLRFPKFYDNNDEAQSLNFESVRVMEKYSGSEGVTNEIKQEEKQNAISKFSVSIPLTTK